MPQYSCLIDRQVFSYTVGLLWSDPEYKQASSHISPFSPVKCTANHLTVKTEKHPLLNPLALQSLPESWIIWECIFGISIVALRVFTLLVLINEN